MKKQKLNVFLIILLVIIWGVLVYKFLFPYLGKQTNEFIVPTSANMNSYKLFKKDTFELRLNKVDPFLNTSYKVKAHKVKPAAIKSKRRSEIVKKTWPSVNYFGFVKSHKHNSKLALLRIDGKLFKVHVGEAIEEVKILTIKSDSIQLQFAREKRYVKR